MSTISAITYASLKEDVKYGVMGTNKPAMQDGGGESECIFGYTDHSKGLGNTAHADV